jgi:hypothetical protein
MEEIGLGLKLKNGIEQMPFLRLIHTRTQIRADVCKKTGGFAAFLCDTH